MESVNLWVSKVLSSVHISPAIIAVVLEKGPDQAVKELQKISLTEPVGSDVCGLLSTAAVSSRKRRAFVLSLPNFTSQFDQLDHLWKWVKVLSTVRYRLLRATVVLAVTHCVETLLACTSADMKQAYLFCGRVSQQVLIPRSRDTFNVVRQIVAESLVRWFRVNNEILTSSVFNSKTDSLETLLVDFMCDEDVNIRGHIVDSLNGENKFDFFSFSENMNVVLNLLLVKAHELTELIESGNPPYLNLLRSELYSLTTLVEKSLKKKSEILDDISLNWDMFYLLLWNKIIPLETRQVVARIVSTHVLGETDFLENKIEMISAFIAEYGQNIFDTKFNDNVWETFFSNIPDSALLISLLMGQMDFDKLAIVGKLNKRKEVDFQVFMLNLNRPKALECMLLFQPETRLETCSMADFLSQANLQYTKLYLAYQVWDKLARGNVQIHEQLESWCRDLPITALLNYHAMESVVKRPVLGEDLVGKLLESAVTGAINSIPLIICALDLVHIQVLKGVATDKLNQTLTILLEEAKQDTSEDGDMLKFYCEYRLDESNKSKERGSFLIDEFDINSFSQYILCNIFDNNNISNKLISFRE